MIPALKALFTSGHAVDLVMAVIVAEFAYLTLRSSRARRPGPTISRILAFAPGVFLLLALRAALTGAGWVWVAVFLALSFPFHLGDVIRRRL